MIKETSQILAAYLAGNRLPASEIPDFIRTTYSALQAVSAGQPTAKFVVGRAQPAVPIKKSVTAAAVTCLECGRHFSMLKRHLRTDHGSSVEQYRQKWGLPASYPMVAADYAARRSQLAIDVGLGRKRPAVTIPLAGKRTA